LNPGIAGSASQNSTGQAQTLFFSPVDLTGEKLSALRAQSPLKILHPAPAQPLGWLLRMA
jgi:hypothetical protein